MTERRVALVVAWLLVAGCGSRSFDPFPTGGEAAGWQRGRVRSFSAAELWQYVDGDAERYLQAGIERTDTARYRYGDSVEATADVHCMRDAAAARRIFDSESPLGSRPVQVGEAARHYGASLTFRRGRYFVRLVADTDSAPDALTELARALDRRLLAAAR